MSIIPPSQIKVYADQLGYSGGDQLSEDVLACVAQHLEYHLRELIQDASKYRDHCRRSKLTVEDLNSCLRDRGQPLLYGYDPMDGLAYRNIPNSDIYYVQNEEIVLADVLNEPLPRSPLPPAITCHALAIDGVQPAIPENPTIQGHPVDFGPIASTGASAREEPEIRPLVRHVLSKELQLYFDTLTSNLLSEDAKASEAALLALKKDAGLRQLLPYLLQFIAEGVPKNLRSPGLLLTLMRSVVCLLENEHLYVEPYLHQLMPPVLTCLVGKRLADDPADPLPWTVRDTAASILSTVCSSYGSTYASLVPRIAKTLMRAWLEGERPLTTQYGAVAGILSLGASAVDSLMLTNMEAYLGALEAVPDCLELDKIRALLIKCAQTWRQSFNGQPGMEEKNALVERLFPDIMVIE